MTAGDFGEQAGPAEADRRSGAACGVGHLCKGIAARARAAVALLQLCHLGTGRDCRVAQVPEPVQHGALLGKHQQQRQYPGKGEPTHQNTNTDGNRRARKSSLPDGHFLATGLRRTGLFPPGYAQL